MISLENKVALVTGASRGIGRAIAITFASLGAKVIINYNSDETSAKETVSLIKDNKKAILKQFDVSNKGEVNDAIKSIVSELGQIDILVNNAGVAKDGLLMRLKDDDIDKQLDINLKGSLYCCRAVIRPMLKNKGGRIINISSVVGQSGNAGQSVYAATKSGIIGMTKSLAKELASRNVLVNAIAPGYIETDMTKDIAELGGDALLNNIPLNRVGTPKDIANAAAFLASENSSYITGHVLSVNGGLYI